MKELSPPPPPSFPKRKKHPFGLYITPWNPITKYHTPSAIAATATLRHAAINKEAYSALLNNPSHTGYVHIHIRAFVSSCDASSLSYFNMSAVLPGFPLKRVVEFLLVIS